MATIKVTKVGESDSKGPEELKAGRDLLAEEIKAASQEEYQYVDPKVCRSIHAGTWYSNRKEELDKQISLWFDAVRLEPRLNKPVKALVVPHMGFAMSGVVSAFAHKYMLHYYRNNRKSDAPVNIFILGSSHFFYTSKCCISSMREYSTPSGRVKVNQEIVQDLNKEEDFYLTDRDSEEQEFSVEMQLPFLAKALDGIPYQIVPIFIGSLEPTSKERYVSILSKYFDDPSNIFIVSTDFCHWGSKYKFSYFNKEDGEIYQSIEKLDWECIENIERHDLSGFTKYMSESQNTICGRHSLEILLNLIERSKNKGKLRSKCLKYSQSNQVREFNDSCITFASILTIMED